MREICLYQDTVNVTPFQFEGHQVRVINLNGEPGFVAKDVAIVLGYVNPQKAVRDHCKEARPLGDERFVHPSLDPQTIIIPESDLYRLIMRSKLPSAERFEALVVGEILPTIRRTGSYNNGERFIEKLNDPTTLRLIIGNYEDHIEDLKGEIEADKPKVDFYDDYVSTEGYFGLQQTGRLLEVGPNKFVTWLKNNRYIIKEGNVLVPRAQYQDRGLFKMISVVKNGRARIQTVITPKGVQHFASKLAAEKFAYLTAPETNMPAIID